MSKNTILRNHTDTHMHTVRHAKEKVMGGCKEEILCKTFQNWVWDWKDLHIKISRKYLYLEINTESWRFQIFMDKLKCIVHYKLKHHFVKDNRHNEQHSLEQTKVYCRKDFLFFFFQSRCSDHGAKDDIDPSDISSTACCPTWSISCCCQEETQSNSR